MCPVIHECKKEFLIRLTVLFAVNMHACIWSLPKCTFQIFSYSAKSNLLIYLKRHAASSNWALFFNLYA